MSRLESEVSLYDRIMSHITELAEMNGLGLEEEDTSFETEIAAGLDALDAELGQIELATLLQGEFDNNDAIISLHPGAGGLESQDWAEMLMRMYLRWAERRGFEVDLNDVQPGEGAGIKSATFTVHGVNAYGYLSCEKGVHRLVRISPFDFSKRRHTSFVSLDVIPVVDEELDTEIDPKDLRIDTYRSSGAGGQHVNVTDSAVRITHLPTGTVVSCQNEKSQLQNKESAMRVLRARLHELAQNEADAVASAQRKSQIRTVDRSERVRTYNYPENRIADHRTGYKAYNLDMVLDGDLDPIVQSAVDADDAVRMAAVADGSSGL